MTGRPVAVGLVLRPAAAWSPAPGSPSCCGHLEHLAEPLAHLSLGQGTEEARGQLAADHGHHHRDALHLQRAR